MLLSIFSIIIVFLISEGYNSEYGFIWSFQNKMHLPIVSIRDGDFAWAACKYQFPETNCKPLKIKYIISGLTVPLWYGILIYTSLLTNPLVYLKKIFNDGADDKSN